MQVDFYIYLNLEKKASAKRFFKCLNWPIAFPQNGWRITFALRRKNPTDNIRQLAVGKVMDEQAEDRYAKVWMNMGEFTESLQNNLMEVETWTSAYPTPPS